MGPEIETDVCLVLPIAVKLSVRPGRFERPAYGFEVRRSIQLSYGRGAAKLLRFGSGFNRREGEWMAVRALLWLVLATGGCAARTLPGAPQGDDLSRTVVDAGVAASIDLLTIRDLEPELPFPPVPVCQGLGQSPSMGGWCFAGPRFGCVVVSDDAVPPFPCWEVSMFPPPLYLYVVEASQGCASCPPP